VNIWALLSVVVIAVLIFALALLWVRVKETRALAIANVALQERTGNEALTVLRMNTDRELAAYAYATKQSEFAMRVLAAYQAGEFKIAEPDLVAAIGRQLDGVAPPRDAPKMAVRQMPRAEWPFEERVL